LHLTCKTNKNNKFSQLGGRVIGTRNIRKWRQNEEERIEKEQAGFGRLLVTNGTNYEWDGEFRKRKINNVIQKYNFLEKKRDNVKR
jgi:hypothetical protein